MAVRTKLVTATSPSVKQCSALARTSVDDARTSRPLISVSAIAARIHTAISDTTTAVCCTIDAACCSVIERISIVPLSGSDGAAIMPVTSVAPTIVSGTNRRSILRIDPPRRTAKQREEHGIHHDERAEERDLRAHRRRTQRRGRREDERTHRLHRSERALDHAQRRHARDEAEHRGRRERDDESREHQRPRTMRRAFPRRERQLRNVDRLRRQLRVTEQRAALFALGEMAGIRIRIFEVPQARVGLHTGSRKVSSWSFSRLRARNSLFLTVPRGSFFIEAISSYDNSA